MRVVLDTSVLIAALRSGKGAAAENLRMALVGDLTMLLDYTLACEYRDVALRREHLEASGKSTEDTALVLNMVEAVAEPVMVMVRHRPLSPHVKDDMVLDVAINGGADAIVTFNIRHFREAARRFHLPVLTPAELLEKYREKG
jgi:predicted nucleic acid-binding protein